MRQLLTLTLLVLCQVSFGQLSLVARANIPDFYVFNNEKDTIYLNKLDLGIYSYTDSIRIVDTIQIDGSGSKEIIFVRHCHGNSEAHGGMFDIEDYKVITKYEIWNLDTKTLLFEAIPVYKNDFRNSYAYNEQWGSYRKGEGSAEYKYDFTIDKNGQVRLSNLKNTFDCKPDHAEGSYKFLNGKYTLE